MAETCLYWSAGKCAAPEYGGGNPCSWSNPNYSACAVYQLAGGRPLGGLLREISPQAEIHQPQAAPPPQLTPSAPAPGTQPLPTPPAGSPAGGTKKCPLCAEEIKAEAVFCRYCHAHLEVTRRGYCANCHEVVVLGGGQVCPRCGGPVVDVFLDTRLAQPAAKAGAAPGPLAPVPASPRTAAPAGRVGSGRLPYGPVQVDGVWVKKRHLLGMFGLMLITLFLYQLYWYYVVNRELRDLGEEVKPWLSLLAVTLGSVLVVPPFVSVYNTASRIRRVQQRSGGWVSVRPGWVVGQFFIPIWNFFWSIVWPIELQSGLNQAYDRMDTLLTRGA